MRKAGRTALGDLSAALTRLTVYTSRYAAELHDYLVEDLQTWYPDIADKVKITLIEALPNVLPMFSKQLMYVGFAAEVENGGTY